MSLKKVVTILLVVLVVMTSGLVIVTKSKFNLYTDVPEVNYTDVLDDVNTSTIYYYYQDTCHFCNSIKDQVSELYLATTENVDINLKLVDVKSAKNAGAWADDGVDPRSLDMSKAENIQITGTPSMIYVEDGQVVEYEVGSDVFKLMENVNEQYQLGLTFDPSKYGEN